MEGAYSSAQASKGDKTQIEAEAKEYAIKGLVSVLKDIDNVAGNLSDFVDLQGSVVDDLTTQVDFINARLKAMKEQRLLYGLEEMKVCNEHRLDGVAAVKVVPSPSSTGSEDPSSFVRVPIAQRLSRLEDVA